MSYHYHFCPVPGHIPERLKMSRFKFFSGKRSIDHLMMGIRLSSTDTREMLCAAKGPSIMKAFQHRKRVLFNLLIIISKRASGLDRTLIGIKVYYR